VLSAVGIRRISRMSAERRLRIREIEDLLSTGVTSHSSDGESVTFSHETLREELRRLKVAEGTQRPRQKVTNIFLG
jgi:hypothetical protein